jgi:hypothetical protein
VAQKMSEKKAPSLPRRRRSRNSLTSEQSDHQSYVSVPEHTGHTVTRTVDLTPSTRSPATVSRGPLTPPNSRTIGESQSGSIKSWDRLGSSLNENQLASKLEAMSHSENRRSSVLTDIKIRAFLEDYFEDYCSIGEGGFEAWSLFFQRYRSPDYLFIRPSGNPIDSLGLANLLSTDIKVAKYILVSIESVTIMKSKRAAIVMYTADQVFSYRGTMNEDRAVFSCVLEYRGDEIKIIHEHRTSGKPIPKETRWSSIE